MNDRDGYDDFDGNDFDDMDHDTPFDPATEAALAELDRIGRHAGQALRSAMGATGATATLAPPRSNGAGTYEPTTYEPTTVPFPGGDGDGDRVTPVLVDLRPARAEGSRRRSRRLPLVLAAAATVVGGVAVALRDTPGEPVQLTPGEDGAPTAVLGDDGGGIWPPEVTRRVLEVASPEHTEVWDQWSLGIPPAGRHLVLDLRGGVAHAAAVLPDLGSKPLQAASVDSDIYLQGSDETAVFGVVDADGTGEVYVERPGAAPIEMHVEVPTGATHNAFVGFVPGDLGPGAEVVAVDATTGAEVHRAPIAPAGGEDSADGIFPDHPKAPSVSFGPEPADTAWGGTATDRGLYVVLSAYGLEDSVTTVVERPGTEPLQVLATHLNGPGMGEAVPVYGLVTADATSIELQAPGHDPLALELVPIAGATHQGFGGWPTDEGFSRADLDEAVVVAHDDAGAEIARRPLDWTRYEVVPG